MSDSFKREEFNFDKYGAFFAFDKDQLDEWRKDNKIEDLILLQGGLVWLKSNYKKMLIDLNNHTDSENKRRIKEVWIDNIIKYELSNYECYYTWDISNAVEVLKDSYWVDEKRVREIFNKNNN